VRVGGSWTHRIELGGFMPIVANLRRTLQLRENGALTIAENGTLSFGNSSKAMRVNDSSIMMLLSGNYNGTTILDEATGFVRSSQITQRLGGTQTVQGKGSTPSMKMRLYMLMTRHNDYEESQLMKFVEGGGIDCQSRCRRICLLLFADLARILFTQQIPAHIAFFVPGVYNLTVMFAFAFFSS
jgi:hypothetical protein